MYIVRAKKKKKNEHKWTWKKFEGKNNGLAQGEKQC